MGTLGKMGGFTAYNISKFGMTMVALGVAQEYAGKGITANSLWPATVVESQASIGFKLGSPAMWRKATILADATMGIILEDDGYTGEMLIDDTYLREQRGFEDNDFVRYRCDPECEPPRALDPTAYENTVVHLVKRGDVRKVNSDIERSSFEVANSKL